MDYEYENNEQTTYNYSYSGGSEQQSAPEPEAPKKHKKNGFWKKALLILGCVVLFGAAAGGAFFGISKLVSKDEQPVISGPLADDKTEPTEATTEYIPDVEIQTAEAGNYQSTSPLDVSDLVEECMPFLVSITNVSVQEVENYYSYFGFYGYNTPTQTQEVTSCGSGIIV